MAFGKLERQIVGLVIGFAAKFVTGSLFVFNVYQGALKDTFNYTQREVEVISSLASVGLGCGFVPGAMFDRYGPQWTSAAGLVISVPAYLLVWSATRFVDFFSDKSWLMAVYFFLIGFGSVFTYMVALNTNIVNFDKKYAVVVVGALNAAFSGSPTVFSVVYYHFFAHGDSADTSSQDFPGFMLLFAICFAVTDILCVICMRIEKQKKPVAVEGEHAIAKTVADEQDALKGFGNVNEYGTVKAIANATEHAAAKGFGNVNEYGTARAIVNANEHAAAKGFGNVNEYGTARAIVNANEHAAAKGFADANASAAAVSSAENVTTTVSVIDNPMGCPLERDIIESTIEKSRSSSFEQKSMNNSSMPEIHEDPVTYMYPYSEIPLSLKQLLVNIDYHFFVWNLAFASSIGLVFVNNVTVISKSLHLESYDNRLTIIIPTVNAIFSLGVGIFSFFFRRKIPKIMIINFGCLCYIVSQILVLFYANHIAALEVATALVGVATSIIWSIFPALLLEMFYVGNIGRNWGLSNLVSAALGFGAQATFGAFYDRAITTAGETHCYGMRCLRGGTIVTVVFGGVALALGVMAQCRRVWLKRRAQND